MLIFILEKKDNAIYDNDGVGAEGLMRLLVVSGASSTAFMPKSSHPAMVPLPQTQFQRDPVICTYEDIYYYIYYYDIYYDEVSVCVSGKMIT